MKDKLVKNAFRRSVGIFLTAAIVCGCTACAEKEADDSSQEERVQLTTALEKSKYQDFPSDVSGEEPVQVTDFCYVSSQIYGTLDQESYSLPDNSRFQLTMHNETGGTFSAGDDFILEVQLDGAWYVVPLICDFTEPAYVNIGEEDTYSYDLADIDVEFISGTYRVLKQYSEEKENGKQLLIGSEFQLTVNE